MCSMSEKQKWTCCCGSEIGEVIDLFRQPNGFVNITMACGQCGKIWTFVGHATTVTYGPPCTTDVDVVEDIYTLPKETP